MTSTPPTPERIRLTITVTPEVHEAFVKLAASSNTSLGRAMGDWLGDTAEAAEMMAKLMEEARAKPKQVIRQLQGMALGMVDASEEVLADLRSGKIKPTPGPRAGDRRTGRASALPPPRPVIRGGKSPNAGKKVGRT